MTGMPRQRNMMIERAFAQARRNPVPERMPIGLSILLWIALALVIWGLIGLAVGWVLS